MECGLHLHPDNGNFLSIGGTDSWTCSSARAHGISTNSDPEESRSFFHILDHFHAKGAAFLASTAGDTIGRVRVQRQVMLANGRRHLAQAPGEIVILMHGGDVDLLRAGQTVVAVHARAVG